MLEVKIRMEEHLLMAAFPDEYPGKATLWAGDSGAPLEPRRLCGSEQTGRR